MQRLLALVVAAFLAAFLANGPPGARAAEVDPALLAAMQQLNTAFETEDKAAIESLVTPDHVAIGPIYPGAVDLAEQFALFPEVQYTNSAATAPVVAMLAPAVALVQYEVSLDGTFRGKPLPKKVYVTAIWVRIDGRWLQKLYQETAVRTD